MNRTWRVLPTSLICAFVVCGFSAAAAIPPQAGTTERTVLDGAYTAGQSERGLAAYTANCSRCHLEDLAGKDAAPPLKGERFIERWREYDLEPLFTLIKTAMPPERSRTPDTPVLSDQTYIDIVTHILRGNGYPAGNTELRAETLDQVKLVGKDGPKPVPDGSLVLVVGCLAQVNESNWVAVNATEPIRAKRSDEATPKELESSAVVPLGTHRFRLVNYDYISPDLRLDPYRGHKIQVKGYLIRQPNAERINVTSLERVAPTCAP
jgi:hypothetical protein